MVHDVFRSTREDPPADGDTSAEDAFLSPTVFVGAVVLLFAACKMAGFRPPEPVRTRLYTPCTVTACVISLFVMASDTHVCESYSFTCTTYVYKLIAS